MIEEEFEFLKNEKNPVNIANKLTKKYLALCCDKSLSSEQVKAEMKVSMRFYVLDNKDIMLEVVKRVPVMLEFASEKFRKDKDIVIMAVCRDGHSLRFADDIFKNNRDIVLVAVKEYGEFLKYASNEVKKDEEVVLTACCDVAGALEYASNNLKQKYKGLTREEDFCVALNKYYSKHKKSCEAIHDSCQL